MKAGRELDEKVICDVLGWELIERSEINTRFPFVAREGKDKLVLWMEDDAVGRYFSPSTNISDAWRVVEYFLNQEWENETPKYIVDFETVKDNYFIRIKENQLHGISWEEESETAPLAICLAALKACGVEG